MHASALTESQRLFLLERLETAITDVRQHLADRLSRQPDRRLRALAIRVLEEERDVCDVVIPHLDLMEYGKWIVRANELERALADFQMGEFGVCEQCRSSIAFSRLKANPAVRECQNCALLPQRAPALGGPRERVPPLL